MTAVKTAEGTPTRTAHRPRVLHVMGDGALAGGAVHVLQIVRGLDDAAQFAVFTEPGSFLAREASLLGVETFAGKLYPRVRPRGLRALRASVRGFRPDLVHAHGARAAFALALAGVDSDVVYTVHGYHFAYRGGPRGAAGALAERSVTKRLQLRQVVFVSTDDARIAERNGFVPPGVPTTVIPNGIACDGARQSNPVPRRVGFVGRLVPQKDPLLFVDALAKLPQHTATIIGDGQLREEVTTAIRRNGLEGRVSVPGELPGERTRQELARFDCLVITSRWEGLPLLVLEAFCAGVPVVATAVGGIADAVEHERTGLLVERDPAAVAEAIERLDGDPPLREQIVARASEQVRTTFSEERMLARIRDVYAGLATGLQQTRTPRQGAR